MVGSHASAISYVIPHILCNCSRVEWVIFWNSCLNFTYKVGTHIRCLGIDATPPPCAASNKGTTQSEEGEYNQYLADFIKHNTIQNKQKAKPHNRHTHDTPT